MKLFAAFQTHSSRSRRAPRVLPPEPVLDDDDDDKPAGCGWFDSSFLLRSGLQITEHASVDSVANDLPLGWWLAWQRAPQRAAVVAAASAAR